MLLVTSTVTGALSSMTSRLELSFIVTEYDSLDLMLTLSSKAFISSSKESSRLKTGETVTEAAGFCSWRGLRSLTFPKNNSVMSTTTAVLSGL